MRMFKKSSIARFVLLVLSICCISHTASAAETWIGTWGSGQQLVNPDNNPASPYLANNTLRQIVHATIGGSRIRVQFSNKYSAGATTINSAHIAVSNSGYPINSSIDTATDTALTFNNGSASVTIPAGQEIYSDAVDFDVAPLSNLTVSIYFGSDVSSSSVTGHPGSRTAYYLKTGNTVSDAEMQSGYKAEHWYVLSRIDVLRDDSYGCVVALGDSITDGRGCNPNYDNRWPDKLADRLHANPDTVKVGVINQGIGANGVLSDNPTGGPSALNRFDHDVIGQPGVKWAIIFEGTNDIGGGASASSLISAYQTFISKAHAANIKIYGATITPFRGNGYYSTAHEDVRQTVNTWIRTPGNFDGVIDFDAAVWDPAAHDYLNPAYRVYPPGDSNDYLHFNAAGFQAMVNAIDINLFVEQQKPDTVTGNMILLNDNGGWCWYQDDKIVYDPIGGNVLISTAADDTGFGGVGGGRTNDMDTTTFNLDTGKRTRIVAKEPFGGDDHNMGAFWIRPDGRYLHIYCSHYNNWITYLRLANYPNDGSSWGSEYTYDWLTIPGPGLPRSDSQQSSYTNVVYLSGEGTGQGRLYNIIRIFDRTPCISYSDDWGATWKYMGRLNDQAGGDTYSNFYHKFRGNGVDRIDFIGVENHPRDNNNCVYHGYIKNGKSYNSYGVEIDTINDQNAPSVQAFTRIFTAATPAADTNHTGWTNELELDKNGYPVCLYQARHGTTPWGDNSGSWGNTGAADHRFYYARFNGTTWTSTELCKLGVGLHSPEQDYTGMGCIHPDDANIVYVSTNFHPVTDVNVGNREIFKGVTYDNGATWDWTQITFNSTVNNTRPAIPKWDAYNTAVVWTRGNWVQTSYENYDLAVVGIIEEEDRSCGIVTYTDASTSNTTNANGSEFSPTDTNSSTDGLWYRHTGYGNGGSCFIAESGTENVPTIKTTVSGLSEGTYDVFAYFWCDPNLDWGIRGGFASDDANMLCFRKQSAQFADASQFSGPVTVTDDNGVQLYRVYIGRKEVSAGGSVVVYLDNYDSTYTGNKPARTTYDGVGVAGVSEDVEDVLPPEPNVMTWATVPTATGPLTITMTATTATDTSPPVLYNFECTTDGNKTSGWQVSPTYVASGLTPSTLYSFKVQARDSSPAQNATSWSSTESATTDQPDTKAPTPDPMTWQTVPTATGPYSITMTASTATDTCSPPVQYYFECTTDGSKSSSWQASATYSPIGLSPSTLYSFRARARDSYLTPNVTGWSSTLSATTQEQPTNVIILGGWMTGLSHPAEVNGTNRALIFIAHEESTTGSPTVTSVTYGGRAMAKIIERSTGTSGYQNYVAAFILKEADINSADAGGAFSVSWSATTSSVSYASVFLSNVNQADPNGASDSNSTTSTQDPIYTKPLATNNGDMAILGVTCGNLGNYTLGGGFTKGTDQQAGSSGHTGATGYKSANGANETPSADFSGTGTRQAIIGFVVKAGVAPTTYTVSGNAGTSGVTMSGLPGSPVSDSNGNYTGTVDYNWSGTVTPAKAGYTFSPVSRTYTSVTSNQTAQNYTATLQTYTISGNAGTSGVTMSGLPGSPVSDSNGNYTGTVDYNWSGTVTPAKAGYTFSPSSRTYTSVTSNQTAQSYTATLQTYTISGNAGTSGVTMSGLPGSPVSDSNGNYTGTVDYNWSGTVTPAKAGYAFSPSSRTYASVTSDQPGQDYTVALLTYKITGYIKNGCNVPITGVLVSANNGGGQSTTDSAGFYEISVSSFWSGTVTPSKLNYTFSPNSMSYSNVQADVTGQNYAASNVYDLDCDGSIGWGDIGVIADNWLSTGTNIPGDLYKDEYNIVNLRDLAQFSSAWLVD